MSAVEGRVLACLIEKQRTVPDQYPLTLLGLVGACNQTTSRDPVMRLRDDEVESAVRSLKATGFVRLVHPTHGRGVTRFRHVADEAWQLDPDDASTPAVLALLSVLVLRGPQTVSELRTRTERQHAFGSVEEVETMLSDLASRGMVRRTERRPGQTQPRWQQLVVTDTTDADTTDADTTDAEGAVPPVPPVPPDPAVTTSPTLVPPTVVPPAVVQEGQQGQSELAELRARVAALDARVARLEAALAELL